MELLDLVNPPANLHYPTYLSVKRYLSPVYLLAVDEFDEAGTNAGVDFRPMARLDQPSENAKEAILLQKKGRAAAFPD